MCIPQTVTIPDPIFAAMMVLFALWYLTPSKTQNKGRARVVEIPDEDPRRD